MTAIVEYDPNNGNKIVSVQFTADIIPSSLFNDTVNGTTRFASIHASRNSSKMGITKIQQLINDFANNVITTGVSDDESARPVVVEFNAGSVAGGSANPYARKITTYDTGSKSVPKSGGGTTKIFSGIRPAAVRAATMSGFSNL